MDRVIHVYPKNTLVCHGGINILKLAVRDLKLVVFIVHQSYFLVVE